MENLSMWLAQERIIEARRKADEARLVRSAHRTGPHRSLLQRIRGGG